MIFEVANDIRVLEPTKELMDWCKKELVIPNPDYYKKVQMGKWTGNTPQNIWLFEKRGDELRIPFGEINTLWKMCSAGKYSQHAFKSFISPFKPLLYKSNINLYDYQEKAVNEAIKCKNGILVMPCGSGKTQCGLEVIARLGGRALWLTHTQDLLNQSMQRAKSVLDIPNSCYGTITGGKVNLGSHITFATVQTMCKLDLAKYKDSFDIVVVDEVQRCAGSPTKVTQFYKVVSSLSARYKYGLTATPKRADGLEKSMFALIGDIIHEVSKDAVADKTCKVVVEKIETGYVPDYDAVLMGDGTLDYSKMVEDLVKNEARRKLVMDRLMQIPVGEPTLVLGNRVEYLKEMCDEYSKNRKALCISGMSMTKSGREMRKNALNNLNTGKLDCIFATYQLAKEGLDVPNLRYVVFATPEKDSTTVIQSVGRVGRKADGKEYGTVIDFVDDFGMYKGWSKKRDGYYKKINAEVVR